MLLIYLPPGVLAPPKPIVSRVWFTNTVRVFLDFWELIRFKARANNLAIGAITTSSASDANSALETKAGIESTIIKLKNPASTAELTISIASSPESGWTK